jgi:hypothetical protein
VRRCANAVGALHWRATLASSTAPTRSSLWIFVGAQDHDRLWPSSCALSRSSLSSRAKTGESISRKASPPAISRMAAEIPVGPRLSSSSGVPCRAARKMRTDTANNGLGPWRGPRQRINSQLALLPVRNMIFGRSGVGQFPSLQRWCDLRPLTRIAKLAFP